jgi:iron complex outermembrane recepter protein
MNNRKLMRDVARVLGFLGSIGVACVSHAEPVSPAETNQAVARNAGTRSGSETLETVLVTAQKREERLIDVPMSVAAISGETLEQKGLNTISDIAHTVPSLSVREAGPGQQLITIRGIGNGRGSSSLVGIYLDDAPLSSIPFSQVDLRVSDLERVEVLRGPQGTLWGEGSVGGTVRFITKQPELTRTSGSINASLSSTEDSDSLGTEVKGMVNVPIVEDVLGVRVSGVYENASGWIDQPDAAREDINDYDLRDVRATVAWRPMENLGVSLSSTIHRVDGGGQSLINVLPVEASRFREPIHPTQSTFLRDDYDIHSLSVRLDLGFAELVSATSYMDKTAENANSNVWQPAPAGSPMLAISAQPKYSSRTFSQEVRLVSSKQSTVNWTVGTFYRDSNDRTGQVLDFASGSTLLLDDLRFGDATDSQSWAVFGDANVGITERLRIGAGLRYFRDDREHTDTAAGDTQSGTFDSVDPRVYATLALTKDVNLYVNAASGFRSGGFNSVGTALAGGPREYDPEKVWSYETGVKSALLDGALRADVSVFYSSYEDIQVLGLIPSFTLAPVTANAGEAEIKGVEAEFAWAPVENVLLGLNGSVIDTEFTKIAAQQTSHLPGDAIDFVPDYSYSLLASRTFPLSGDNSEFAVSVDYSVQGRATETNRAAGLLVPIAKSEKLSFLNASIRFQRESWMFELFADNLLDERDLLFPSVFGYAAQGRPRTYGLRASYVP